MSSSLDSVVYKRKVGTVQQNSVEEKELTSTRWGWRTLASRQRSQWRKCFICITSDCRFWLYMKWLGTLSTQNEIICEAVCLLGSLDSIEIKMVICACYNPRQSKVTPEDWTREQRIWLSTQDWASLLLEWIANIRNSTTTEMCFRNERNTWFTCRYWILKGE